jgi:hypothetical protein
MSRGDGKGKQYRQMQLHKDVFTLIKYYNRVLKKKALSDAKGTLDGTFGKTYR